MDQGQSDSTLFSVRLKLTLQICYDKQSFDDLLLARYWDPAARNIYQHPLKLSHAVCC